MYRYPYLQPAPTFWDGLANGLLSGMQKNMEAKQNADMFNQLAGFGDTLKNLDTGGQTHLQYNGPNQAGTNVQDQATQGLFKNVIGTTPTSQDLWQGGLLGKSGTPQPPTFTPGQPTAYQTNQFNQDLTSHPEWFRNGITQGSKVYVGDNANIANNAIVSDSGQVTDRTQQTAPAQSNYSFKSDFLPDNVTKTISNAPTMSEYKSMVRGQIPLAAKELAAKGYDPSKFMPYLLQMTNDRIADYTDQYNKTQMQSALATLNDAKADDRTAAKAAFTLSQLGIKVPSGFIQAFKNPDLKHVVVNAGGQQVLKSFNPKTGEFTDGGSIDVTNTPHQNAMEVIAQQNADANTEKAHAATISANRPRGNGGTPKAVKIQGNSGSVYNANQVYQAKNDAQEYYARQSDGSLELASDSDMKRYSKAAAILNDVGDNAY